MITIDLDNKFVIVSDGEVINLARGMVVRTNKDSESIGYGVKVGKRRWRLRNLSKK